MSWAGDWIELRRRFRLAREAAGMRQADVAKRLGISVRHFARLESGETDAQARILFAWANALGLTVKVIDRTHMAGEGAAQA